MSSFGRVFAGWYQLDKHRNVNKGIKARGPLAAELVDYLAAIRPPNASGPIHFNPSTGEPYVDIRKQWNRLLEIAGRMLGYDLEGKKGEFFNFRHTGASHIAQRGKNARAPARRREDDGRYERGD